MPSVLFYGFNRSLDVCTVFLDSVYLMLFVLSDEEGGGFSLEMCWFIDKIYILPWK